MTVKDLIAKLREQPEDAQVFMPDNESGLDYSPVLCIDLEPGNLSHTPFMGGDLTSFRPVYVGDRDVNVGPVNFKAIILR
jgi:hypothetical protein